MAHTLDRTHTTRIGATPPEWLGVGKQIADLCNKWSGRTDVMAYVGPEAGAGAAACFNFATNEIEVDVERAFGAYTNPEDIDLTRYRGRYAYPQGVGAIMHEASHAEHTEVVMSQSVKDLDIAPLGWTVEHHRAMMLLEETRIERLFSKKLPRSRPFLKACALDLALAPPVDPKTGEPVDITITRVSSAVNMLGLVHARVDAEILEEDDVSDLMELVDAQLGPDLVEKLRGLAISYQDHDSSDVDERRRITREWVDAVREARHEEGEKAWDELSEDEKDAVRKFMKALGKALGDAVGRIGVSVTKEMIDAETREELAEWLDGLAVDERERDSAVDAAVSVFGDPNELPPDGDAAKNSRATSSSTSSKLVKERPPTGDELAAAITVARMLERARYRDHAQEVVASAVPPGRLRMRTVMQGRAQKMMGSRAAVEPYKAKRRRYTEYPPLTIGVLVDISGSMGGAMEPMAAAAYVMAEAGRRVQATTAMVYYGNSVFPTLRPGERMSSVRVYSARDMTESFDKAFRAIDGKLNLLHGSGARMLFIVSDGCYTTGELAACKRWMARCHQQGVGVVWLPFDSGDLARDVAGPHAEVITEGMDHVSDVAIEIGRASAEVLSKR